LAYQTKDLIEAMEEDSKTRLASLKVDGGACANDLLMQFQADMLNANIERPVNTESTALGAAYLAGIAVGLWKQEDILKNKRIDRTFEPSMKKAQRERLYEGWKKAVKRTMNWIDE
ncbi:MAG: glycerol kinase, partial [Flavobacteriaceae bacterium]|nr:glycerol kinase [Flavobacteriaceae bacterium]